MTVYEKLKQEQDSLLEKEGSMKMDQNLTVSYEEQKAQWQERKKQQQKENAGIFKKLAPTSLIYALIYTVCIYKNMTGAAVLLWVVATIGYICYIVKTVKERKVFKTTIIFAVYMLILAVSTFTTGNEWIIWMNYCWIFAFTVCFLIRNMADENEWNFWDYLCGGVNAVFGAIGSIARPFGDGNDFARLREKKENGKAREILIGIAVAIPVVLLIGGLLMSADLVFSNMIAKVFEGIRIPANLAGICFSFISSYCGVRYTAYRKDRQDREVKILTETTAMFTVSVLVAVLYVIFCGIQIIYLFGGGGELPAGVTYAEYARQGFFQLLVVCILNLGAVLTMEHFFQRNRAVDAVLTVISVCTIIMTASSGWRMILYIRAYQLTFLRVVVLVALAVITLLMAGTICYIWNRRFPLFQYGMAVVCVSYVLFAFAHVDAGIAAYDLAQIENGNTAGDYSYLSCLSTDAAPVIAEYLKEHPDKSYYGDGIYNWKWEYMQENDRMNQPVTLRTFNLSYLRAKRIFSEK